MNLRFLAEYRERNTVRAKSDRVGEGTGGMFPEEEDKKRQHGRRYG